MKPEMPQSPKQDTNEKWIITLSESPLTDSNAIAFGEKLDSVGFEVEEIFQQIGVITGSATEEVAKKVADIPGVAFIGLQSLTQLTTPESTK